MLTTQETDGVFTDTEIVGNTLGLFPAEEVTTDITEHPTREGKIYCCVVLDAFSRMVVGWAIDSTQTTALVTTALGMATSTRNPDSGLVLHSDRGVQCTSWASAASSKTLASHPRWEPSGRPETMPWSSRSGDACR
jgi:transposase InsO family protein